MSTRGLTPDLNRDDFTTDLHAVVQKLGLRSFVLMGTQSFGHVGVRYVVEHPGEVRALVLVSCPISMESWPLGALNSLGDRDWEALLRALAGLSQAGDVTASVQRQKDSITQADWLTIRRLTDTSSVADLLPRLVTPTLVLHPRDSLNMPPRETQELAARIPDSQMVLIDGATPLGDASQGMRAIDEFLATLEERSNRDEPLPPLPGNLSSRQLEVLRLIGMGKTNREIATTLILSERTVERHVADVYAKIGAANRAQAAVYAQQHGLV
jgi:DNA-binding CsgD family transcriptional regulator